MSRYSYYCCTVLSLLLCHLATAEKAVFAGGCFWCMQPPFDKLAGINKTRVGYTGGAAEHAHYTAVSRGDTQHVEAVEVDFDPKQITYAQLLDVFWRNVDPVDGQGQFCDRGPQYRSAIFFANKAQQQLAEQSKRKLATRYGFVIKTNILPLKTFYPAESYHQDYYKTNALRYRFYRYQCGRDKRLNALYGE